MLHRILPTVAIVFLVVIPDRSSAETTTAREFSRLKEQREKAVASAIASIDQKYHEMLKSLLTRATQQGDYDTITAITEILSLDSASAAPRKQGIAKAGGAASAGIWTPANSEGVYYLLITNQDSSVEGLLYIEAPDKSAPITGNKSGNVIQAHWPTVYRNESYEGTLVERPDGGLDLNRINADGPSKGRKDTFELRRLTGAAYQHARKLLESRVTTTEDQRMIRKLSRE